MSDLSVADRWFQAANPIPGQVKVDPDTVEAVKAEFKQAKADRRTHLAGLAMQALIPSENTTPQMVAEEAIEYADAIIAALDKPADANTDPDIKPEQPDGP